MLNVRPRTERPDNPDALVVKTLAFNFSGPKHLRLMLVTADNKPCPYYLIQIFTKATQEKYPLNFTITPGPNTLEDIKNNLTTSLETILNAINVAMAEGLKVFDVPNGKEYIDYFTKNKEMLERKAGQDIDQGLRSWMGW